LLTILKYWPIKALKIKGLALAVKDYQLARNFEFTMSIMELLFHNTQTKKLLLKLDGALSKW
jgi:hypothetical protein